MIPHLLHPRHEDVAERLIELEIEIYAASLESDNPAQIDEARHCLKLAICRALTAELDRGIEIGRVFVATE